MDWDEAYRKGEVFWDKGEPSPVMKQYLGRHQVRGRALVPGCGHAHEVMLAVAHGLDATGLDIAPTAIAEAQALYPAIAGRLVVGDLRQPALQVAEAGAAEQKLADDQDGPALAEDLGGLGDGTELAVADAHTGRGYYTKGGWRSTTENGVRYYILWRGGLYRKSVEWCQRREPSQPHNHNHPTLCPNT